MGRAERSSPHVTTELTVRIDGRAYAWHERLLPFPDDADEWWHPGLAVAPDGTVLAFRQGGRRLVSVGAAGDAVVSARQVPLRIGHGIAVVEGTGDIWVADPGLHARLVDGRIVRETNQGLVVRTDGGGHVTGELEAPPLPVYAREPYRPTSVALVTDQVWIADGYGQSLVHRYAANGGYLGHIDGTEAGGDRFNCPHALFLDPRASEPLVWVADRGNAMLRAYDADGVPVRTAGAGMLTSPSGVTTLGDLLVVAELSGWLAVLDADGRLATTVASSGRHRDEPGWPNVEAASRTVRPSLRAGSFNSPHAVASRADGSLLVAEWLLGGRLVELRPLAS